MSRSNYLELLFKVFLTILLIGQLSLQEKTNPEVANKNELQRMESINKTNIYDWIRLYVSQHSKKYYQVKTIEDSIDQRAANLNKVNFLARYISDDINRFDQDDPKLRDEYERFISGPEVNPEQCTQHLERMVYLVEEFREINSNKRKGIDLDLQLSDEHLHITKILDSFGRYEAGILDGKHILSPINRECHETRLILDSKDMIANASMRDVNLTKPSIKMRVCLANLNLIKYLDQRLKSPDNMKFSGRSEGSVRLGLCLPSSCHSSDLLTNKHLIQYLVDDQITAPDYLYISKYWELGDEMLCLNDHKQINHIESPRGESTLTVLCLWIVAIVLCTYFEAELSSSQRVPSFIRTLSRCLNIKTSVDKLFSLDRDDRYQSSSIITEQQTDRVNLEALNFIKFLNMVSVIAVNTWLMHVARSMSLGAALSVYEKNLFVRWLMNTPILVDSTFVISAALLSFAILIKLDSTGCDPLNSVQMFMSTSLRWILLRYLRFVPLYFIYHWFKRNVVLYIGYGALWDPGFNKYTIHGGCKQESWWTPFTPISAYLPFGQQCLPQAWSIGCELLAAAAIIPLTLAIRKKIRFVFVVCLLLALTTSGMAYNAILDKINLSSAWQHLIKLDATSIVVFFNEFSAIYVRAHYRIGAGLIGLWTGFALFCFNKGHIKEWPELVKGVGTKAALITILFLLFIRPLVFAYDSIESPLKEHLVLHSFAGYRLLWALANMILFLRLTTDWKDTFIIGKLFSGSFFKATGKLHFSMLLIHLDIITMFVFMAEGSTDTTVAIGLVSEALSNYFYSLLLAIPVYVLFENPFSEMTKQVLCSNFWVGKTKQKQQ